MKGKAQEWAAGRRVDAALIRRVLDGEAAAFDTLVARHRHAVLRRTYAVLRDWDAAEDAAQQALLQAYGALGGLKDPGSFGGWVLTIAQRCACRGRLQAPAGEVTLSEAVRYPVADAAAATDDLAESLHASLAELTARSRAVMVGYYLHGRSCRDIALGLGLPVGTVKRILHDSRASMREHMRASPRGEETMARRVKEAAGPRRLAWFINGDTGPGALLRPLLAQSICLSVNRKANTIEGIAEEVKAHPAYVRQSVEALVEEGVLRREADGRCRAGFVALDAADWQQLTRDAARHGAEAAEALRGCIPELRAAWEGTGLPAAGFAWEQGRWLTLAVFVCNCGVARRGPTTLPTWERASGQPYCLFGHEWPEAEESWLSGFSCRLSDEPLLSYGYWWSRGVNREEMPLSGLMADLLTGVARGDPDILRLVQDPVAAERRAEALARLMADGVIRRRGDALQLAFPVLTQAENETLWPAVEAAAESLCRDVLLPGTAETCAWLADAGYGHLADQLPLWRTLLTGMVADEGLRALVRDGALVLPSDPAPASFAAVGWFGRLPVISWNA